LRGGRRHRRPLRLSGCRNSESLVVNEAILYLKDGQNCTVCMPVGREFQDIFHFMRVPADAAGRTLRFQVPTGVAIDVSAADIASLEISPSYALIPDFMMESELEKVLAFTMTHAAAFQNSGVHDAPNQNPFVPTNYRIRRSRVLDGPANGMLAAMMMPKLQELMPKLWSQLRINPLPFSAMECQITAHGDGDFFATHTDNGTEEIAHRQISYVYYFHREPKQFGGGHLSLYHTLYQNGYGKCGRLAADIEPPRNGLMVFPTFVFHEVTPIRCASPALTDQRLTLNGWLF
jgi:predicted 2-oxoglutarate/Fe(II)-dependent dioxygenase YbiX